MPETTAAVSGIDLKVERVRLRVGVKELAQAGNWKHHSSVSNIERLDVVPAEQAQRYRDALATFDAEGAA